MEGQRPDPRSEPTDARAAFALYQQLLERGEAPSFAEHCARFPHLRAELEGLMREQQRVSQVLGNWAHAGSLSAELVRRFGPAGLRDLGLEPEAAPAPGEVFEELFQKLRIKREGFGRYRIKDEVGHGGMGVVLRVWDDELKRHLAMKLIKSGAGTPNRGAADTATVGRFLDEAQVTAQLEHPGIVPVHELGLDSAGNLYFTMRLVKGRDLGAILELARTRHEQWSQPRALGVLLKACEALAYAHSKGVIHRDLKPANIMVGRFGEVYVMDWGLAKVLGLEDRAAAELKEPSGSDDIRSERSAHIQKRAATPGSPLVTRGGHALGTPAYMPPEQARGDLAAMGPHSDVYSMGAILYHLLTERMPYGDSQRELEAHQVLAQLLRGAPTRVVELAPGQPPELVAICERAMEREPKARYPSVIELAEDLRAFLEHRVVKAHRTGALAELGKWVERNKAFTGATAAGFLVLVAGVGVATSSRMQVNAAVTRQRMAELTLRLAALDEDESGSDKVRQLNEYSAAAEGVADIFESWGVSLDGTQDIAGLARAMESLEPAVRTALAGGVYQLVRQIGLAGLGQAAHYFHEGGAPAGHEATWRLMAENHLRLVRIWPRALGLLEALGDQPFGARAARSFESLLLGKATELELPDDWMASATPFELDFVSFVLQRLGGRERAVPVLEAAMIRDPGVFWLHARRGMIAMQAGDPATARLHLTAAVALRPKSRTARNNLAYALEKLGDLPGAIALWRSVVELDSDHFEGVFNLAAALTDTDSGALEEAIALLKRIRPVAPDDPEVVHVLGLALDKRAEKTSDPSTIDEAIEAFLRWTELQPDSWEAHYRLGMAYQLREDHEEALLQLERSLELLPGKEDVIFARVDSLWELGRREEALDACARALEDSAAPKILELYEELLRSIEDPAERAPHEELIRALRESR